MANFGREVESTLKGTVTQTLGSARIAIMSIGLFDAMKLSSKNLQQAKIDINKQVSPAALRMSGIKPMTDIHSVLWRLSGEVLKGKVVQMG